MVHGYATHPGIPTDRQLMSDQAPESATSPAALPAPATAERDPSAQPTKEIGGPRGPEPTRYGDWERKGRCIDF